MFVEGAEKPPPKARLAVRSLPTGCHTHTRWLTRKPSSLTPTPLARSRNRVACGAKKSEGCRCCAQFHSSARDRSGVACGAGRSEGGEAVRSSFVGSGPKPTSLRRKKEGGKSHALDDARVEASTEPGHPRPRQSRWRTSTSSPAARRHRFADATSYRSETAFYQVSRRRAHASVRNARGNAIVYRRREQHKQADPGLLLKFDTMEVRCC